MAEFASELGTRSGGGRRVRGLLPQLLVAAVAIAIIIFAAVMTGSFSGSNFAFFLLVFILPILRRLGRSITRGDRRRSAGAGAADACPPRAAAACSIAHAPP